MLGHWNCIGSQVTAILLNVELHQEGSAPATCAAGLFHQRIICVRQDLRLQSVYVAWEEGIWNTIPLLLLYHFKYINFCYWYLIFFFYLLFSKVLLFVVCLGSMLFRQYLIMRTTKYNFGIQFLFKWQ